MSSTNDEYSEFMQEAYKMAAGKKETLTASGPTRKDESSEFIQATDKMAATLSDHEVENIKSEVATEVNETLRKLEKDYPGATEGVATALGASTGGAGSLIALTYLGTTGLSAAGITSGLAAAGSIVGGGMVAGIGVLAAPIAILGVAGYALAKKRQNAKLAAALGQAIAKLYALQNRLMENAEYFKAEIASIKATIEVISKKKPA